MSIDQCDTGSRRDVHMGVGERVASQRAFNMGWHLRMATKSCEKVWASFWPRKQQADGMEGSVCVWGGAGCGAISLGLPRL